MSHPRGSRRVAGQGRPGRCDASEALSQRSQHAVDPTPHPAQLVIALDRHGASQIAGCCGLDDLEEALGPGAQLGGGADLALDLDAQTRLTLGPLLTLTFITR